MKSFLIKSLSKYKTAFNFSKQITVLIFTFAVFSAAAFGAQELTPYETEKMAELSDFRLKLGLSATCEEAVGKIEDYRQSLENQEVKSRLSDEIQLAIANILVWEEYNYLYESDIAHPALKGLITSQYEEVKRFFREHKKEEHNKWLYSTAADILSCCMQFLPLTTAMHEGLTIKKYYDAALEIDPDMVFCLINIAQWYFYAPVINGGGHGKAQKALEHAVAVSGSVPELYYSKELLSQVLFEDDKFDQCIALLAEADSLLPGTRSVKHLRRINSAGYSYFNYTMNRKKIDAKLAKLGI